MHGSVVPPKTPSVMTTMGATNLSHVRALLPAPKHANQQTEFKRAFINFEVYQKGS
jgi:hypothetical protein